jgi:RNA polymerase sigma factor, sigma-70 family
MMDGFQIQEAWKQFKVYGDPHAREQLIRQYAHLVKLTVARIVPYPPNGMEWEDLYSYGVMGLIRAVDMFDPTRNVKFETYAIALIRGAVLEALRSEDWVPRSARDKLRQLERVWVRLEASLGRPPTDEEAADALGVSVHDYRQLLIDYARTNTISLEACLINGDDEENNNLLETIADAEDPYEELLESGADPSPDQRHREPRRTRATGDSPLLLRGTDLQGNRTGNEHLRIARVSDSFSRAGAPARATMRFGGRP